MADKPKVDAGLFEEKLARIDAEVKELQGASNKLRQHLKILCSRVEKIFDNDEDAKRFVISLQEAGWKTIDAYPRYVRAEGILVTPLKKAGLAYRSKKAVHTDYEDDPPFDTIYECFVGFGVVGGAWQFYLNAVDHAAGEVTDYAIDNMPRDMLLLFMNDLPRFLDEMQQHIADKKKEVLQQSEEAKKLAMEFSKAVEKTG